MKRIKKKRFIAQWKCKNCGDIFSIEPYEDYDISEDTADELREPMSCMCGKPDFERLTETVGVQVGENKISKRMSKRSMINDNPLEKVRKHG